MNSIEISGQTGSVSESNAFAFKDKDSSPVQGPGFGQVFSTVMTRSPGQASPDDPAADASAPPAGQELAESMGTAATSGQVPETPLLDPAATGLIGGQAIQGLQGLWLPGQSPLKAVTLGPGMNAITPSTVEPDMASLADFARAQGLDEHAVRWLFQGAQGGLQGKAEGASVGADGASVAAGGLAGIPLTAMANAATLPAAVAQPLTGATTEETSTNPDTATADPSGGPAAPAALILGALSGLEQPLSRSVAPAPSASEVARSPEPTESLMINLRMVAPPLWMQRAANAAAKPETAAPAQDSEDVQAALDGLLPEEGHAPADIHTVELDLSDVLRELRSPAGPGTAVMLAALNQGRADADPALPGRDEEMDLKIEGTDPLTRPADAPAHKTAANELMPARTPVTAANPGARLEQMQQQADKMGQAIGQRMLSEIEKGHWEMKMMLRPATLGHIEVQMSLRGGELDASFNAPQAMTRELLQDGLSRLRETLTQAGMNVANIHVGDNSSQKRGGESTPGQAQASASSGQAEKQEPAQETVTQHIAIRRNDGWDVMV